MPGHFNDSDVLIEGFGSVLGIFEEDCLKDFDHETTELKFLDDFRVFPVRNDDQDKFEEPVFNRMIKRLLSFGLEHLHDWDHKFVSQYLIVFGLCAQNVEDFEGAEEFGVIKVFEPVADGVSDLIVVAK